jgi:hypothetical protein
VAALLLGLSTPVNVLAQSAQVATSVSVHLTPAATCLDEDSGAVPVVSSTGCGTVIDVVGGGILWATLGAAGSARADFAALGTEVRVVDVLQGPVSAAQSPFIPSVEAQAAVTDALRLGSAPSTGFLRFSFLVSGEQRGLAITSAGTGYAAQVGTLVRINDEVVFTRHGIAPAPTGVPGFGETQWVGSERFTYDLPYSTGPTARVPFSMILISGANCRSALAGDDCMAFANFLHTAQITAIDVLDMSGTLVEGASIEADSGHVYPRSPLPPPEENRPPVAVAAAVQMVRCVDIAGTSVRLDGSASRDPDGDPLTYRWTGPFPEGNGTIAGANPTLTLAFGRSTITLVVNDGQQDSVPITLDVVVAADVRGLLPPLERLVPTGSAVPMSERPLQAGRTIPLQFQMFCGAAVVTDLDVPSPVLFRVVRVSAPLPGTVAVGDAGAANDNGAFFRYSYPNWVYNLSTGQFPPGDYVVTLETPDGLRYDAGMELK